MKSLADSIRLRRFRFRFCMVHVFLVEIKLIFMMFQKRNFLQPLQNILIFSIGSDLIIKEETGLRMK